MPLATFKLCMHCRTCQESSSQTPSPPHRTMYVIWTLRNIPPFSAPYVPVTHVAEHNPEGLVCTNRRPKVCIVALLALRRDTARLCCCSTCGQPAGKRLELRANGMGWDGVGWGVGEGKHGGIHERLYACVTQQRAHARTHTRPCALPHLHRHMLRSNMSFSTALK